MLAMLTAKYIVTRNLIFWNFKAQGEDKLRAVLNTVKNYQVSLNAGNFFNSSGTISF